MDILIQQIVSGLATGGIYASLALALVMIYQATDVVNFAQGSMAMFSTYLCWSLLQAGLPYWVAFFATTGVDGRFEITGLPAGQYTLTAWHEMFGRKSQSLTIANETKPVEATFRYKAP